MRLLPLLIVMPFTSIWNGYVLSVLWRWFIAPALGLPLLDVPTAIGIALVVGYMTKNVDADNEDEGAWETVRRATLTEVIRPSFALGVGWIVSLFL